MPARWNSANSAGVALVAAVVDIFRLGQVKSIQCATLTEYPSAAESIQCLYLFQKSGRNNLLGLWLQ